MIDYLVKSSRGLPIDKIEKPPRYSFLLLYYLRLKVESLWLTVNEADKHVACKVRSEAIV